MSNYNCPFKHLLVLDFETTCDEGNYDYPFEIIQFSVLVIDVQNNIIIDGLVFDKYVRPIRNPILSKFCSNFTGISQNLLDAADTFDIVYQKFLIWLAKNEIREKNFAIVCDSSQDLWRIAQYQFRLIKWPMPSMFRQWINIKRTFDGGLEDGEQEKLIGDTNIEKMRNHFGIKVTGRAHDALSDCMSLAQITRNILQTGCLVNINETLSCSAPWRKQSLDMKMCSEWKTDFYVANRVYERILPLVRKQVDHYDMNDYGSCSYCRAGPTSCGSRHRQFPKELYQNLQKPSNFARTADYY